MRVEGETIWLTQEQIALLFGTQRPAITKHLNNIYKCGELDEPSTCSILERMGNDGRQIYQTKYYNLDAILSVGYRVNSVNATHKWSIASHDRWLIIDDTLYHCGHSFKDMGKKLCAIMRMGASPESIINQIK